MIIISLIQITPVKLVSSKIREMKNISEEYVIGEEVICRKYIKNKGTKI